VTQKTRETGKPESVTEFNDTTLNDFVTTGVDKYSKHFFE
jgi:hypothetical protein